MNTRPLVYYWKALYKDGTELQQFDPQTYEEVPFTDIDQTQLIKFGLYPFNRELAQSVKSKGESVACIPILSKYELHLDEHKQLIYYRDVFISQEEYHLCRACGKEFTYNSQTQVIESKYTAPICPHCGKHDLFKCKSCGKEYSRIEDTKFNMCECGSHLDRIRLTSGQYHREKRWIYYYLGYKTSLGGATHKMLMRIYENGNTEIM